MIIKQLGLQPYQDTWDKMRALTDSREKDTPDELWLLEHEPVYTQGQAGRSEHLLNIAPHIPVIQTDRGGQVTYHGPGQLIAYVLMDLNRKKWGIRTLVCQLENVLIETVHAFGIEAHRKTGAPGVYVADKKIASIGLRVRKGCTYHGIALNVDMDLNPFQGINPCGYRALTMTQLKDFSPSISMDIAKNTFLTSFRRIIGVELCDFQPIAALLPHQQK